MVLKSERHIKRLNQNLCLLWHGRPARDLKASRHGQDAHATTARPFTLSPLPFTLSLRRRRAGFTLIEILVAILLLALILVLLIYPFISATNFLGKGRTRADVQRVAAQAMDTMVREISQATEVEIATDDPSICVFALPQQGVYPQISGDTIVRYWQVWRSNPNAAPAAGSPISGSWYDKFNPDPKKNLSSMNDNDSRFIARTVFSRALAASSELYLMDVNDPDALNRSVPLKTGDSITDKEKFIAISPNRSECDVPILRFDLVKPNLLKISLTVSERDPKTGSPQDMHLERLVELKNHVN